MLKLNDFQIFPKFLQNLLKLALVLDLSVHQNSTRFFKILDFRPMINHLIAKRFNRFSLPGAGKKVFLKNVKQFSAITTNCKNARLA